MMLWPQAWPTPGRASYSAQTATTSGPEPISALKAVGRPATPAGRRAKPPSARASAVQARGPVLLEGSLGVVVDGVAERDQVVERRPSMACAGRAPSAPAVVGHGLDRPLVYSMTAMTSPGPTESPGLRP